MYWASLLSLKGSASRIEALTRSIVEKNADGIVRLVNPAARRMATLIRDLLALSRDGRTTVKRGPLPEAAGHWTFKVRDNGIGIAEEVRKVLLGK